MRRILLSVLMVWGVGAFAAEQDYQDMLDLYYQLQEVRIELDATVKITGEKGETGLTGPQGVQGAPGAPGDALAYSTFEDYQYGMTEQERLMNERKVKTAALKTMIAATEALIGRWHDWADEIGEVAGND